MSKSSTGGSTGLKVYHPQNFYFIYTNLSISENSEKSPLWKVFLSHIPEHYRI